MIGDIMAKKEEVVEKTPDVEYLEDWLLEERKKNPVKLMGIQLKASGIIRGRESKRLVGKFVDLLEIINLKKKELRKLERAKARYESDPEAYCDKEDGLW
jgi:hypothetical protein